MSTAPTWEAYFAAISSGRDTSCSTPELQRPLLLPPSPLPPPPPPPSPLKPGDLAAFLVFHKFLQESRPHRVFVDQVWVHPCWRGRGVAGGMMRRAVYDCVGVIEDGGYGISWDDIQYRVWGSPGWAVSMCFVELMVRVEGRRGRDAECDPTESYTRLGLSKGRVGECTRSAGGGSGYGPVEGCVYMCGTLRPPSCRGVKLEEVGSVRNGMANWKGWGDKVGEEMVSAVADAHGISRTQALESVTGKGAKGRMGYLVVRHGKMGQAGWDGRADFQVRE